MPIKHPIKTKSTFLARFLADIIGDEVAELRAVAVLVIAGVGLGWCHALKIK